MRSATVLLALLVLMPMACSRADPYDESRMDLHPSPATLSAQRHTGEFAMGGSLSGVPDVPPLDPAPVKTIQLDVVDRVIDLALACDSVRGPSAVGCPDRSFTLVLATAVGSA